MTFLVTSHVQENGINPAGTFFIGFAGPNIYTRTNGNVGACRQTRLVQPALGTRVAVNRGGFSTWGDAAWIGDQRLTFGTVNPGQQRNQDQRFVHGRWYQEQVPPE